MKHSIQPLLATLALLLVAPVSAFAACASPSGNEGDMTYNLAFHVPQFCDGTIWRAMGRGTVPAASTPTTDAGYFVITSGSWNGNLGGTVGANAKCLSDLTANDWMGKTDASNRGLLNSTNVNAFLCASNFCTTGVAGVTYYFAVSGDNTKGGASMTLDNSGNGPNDSANWSGATYFNGSKEYWTSRDTQGGSTNWVDYANHGWDLCSNWTSASSANTAQTGASSQTGQGRWNMQNWPVSGPARSCDLTERLVCFVHP